jgi:hypothetical protein
MWDQRNGTWKENVMRELFDTQGIDAVMNLQYVPRPEGAAPDEIVCIGTKNDRYKH